MEYYISKLNRTVALNDELVQEYCKYDELREHSFSIVIKTKFGHNPSQEEISDEELSALCNQILFSELKAFSLLPKALSTINNITAF